MITTVRAWEIRAPIGPAGLSLVVRPDPPLAAHDVRVRTRAVSLNHRDLLMIRGRYRRTLPPSAVPCSDAAGEVVEVGPAVTRVAVGDGVTSTFAPAWVDGPYSLEAARSALGAGDTVGVLADTFVLPEHGVVPLPEGLTFEQAATLPGAALTAWHALMEEAPLPQGATVLTMGTGGVSVFALQLARAAGARVIATSSRDEKLDRLRELGAAEVVNYAAVPEWGPIVRDLAGGAGVDHVLEVGGEGTLAESIRAVRFGGTITLVGTLAPHVSAPPLLPVIMRNIRLQGIVVGSRAMFERMNAFLVSGRVAPVIDTVAEFDDAPDAFARLAAADHVGKVVVRVP